MRRSQNFRVIIESITINHCILDLGICSGENFKPLIFEFIICSIQVYELLARRNSLSYTSKEKEESI